MEFHLFGLLLEYINDHLSVLLSCLTVPVSVSLEIISLLIIAEIKLQKNEFGESLFQETGNDEELH